jgi:hypothetical protein
VAIASGVVLGAVIIASLVFWKPAFMAVVVAAVVVAVWELSSAFATGEIRLTRAPVMAGGVVMVLVAFLFGAPALVAATALTALVSMLWRLRGGVTGYVMDTTAAVFTIVYVPFLGGFVALLLAEKHGALAIVTFILVTIASDIGGYVGPVLRARRLADRGVPAPRAVVGRRRARPGGGRDGHAGRPVRVGDQARPRDQGHVADRPRARRPDGPAGLSARDGGPGVAAAALPGVLEEGPCPMRP